MESSSLGPFSEDVAIAGIGLVIAAVGVEGTDGAEDVGVPNFGVDGAGQGVGVAGDTVGEGFTGAAAVSWCLALALMSAPCCCRWAWRNACASAIC